MARKILSAASVSAVTVSPVSDLDVGLAVWKYAQAYVVRRFGELGNVHGSRTRIATELGCTPSNVTHIRDGKTKSLSSALEQRLADLLHEGRVDDLRREAIRRHEDSLLLAASSPVDLPPDYHRAIGRLEVRIGRDLTAAARELFAREPNFHLAEGASAELLDRQIQEIDAEMKGKAEHQRAPAPALTAQDEGVTGPAAMAGSRSRKKKESKK